MKSPQYLVRPSDSHIWELDPSNNCYRSYDGPKYSDGTPRNADDHYTYEFLLQYGFFPIDETEIPTYEAKCKYHYGFISWQHRNDGHGGCKGGTEEEYKAYLERVKQYQESLKKENVEETKPSVPAPFVTKIAETITDIKVLLNSFYESLDKDTIDELIDIRTRLKKLHKKIS